MHAVFSVESKAEAARATEAEDDNENDNDNDGSKRLPPQRRVLGPGLRFQHCPKLRPEAPRMS